MDPIPYKPKDKVTAGLLYVYEYIVWKALQNRKEGTVPKRNTLWAFVENLPMPDPCEALKNELAETKRLLAECMSGKDTSPIEPDNTGVPFFDSGIQKLGNISKYFKTPDPYSAQVTNPDLIKVVDDPTFGNQRRVMHFDVGITQTGNVTSNPRAQIQTPMQYTEGMEVFTGFSTRFPDNFPDFVYWMTLAEIYGAPYRGTSPFLIGCQMDNLILQFRKPGESSPKTQWREKVRKNKWYDHVYRTILSKDAAIGEIQVWQRVEGEGPEWKEILPTTKIVTLAASNLEGPQYQKICLYYSAKDMFQDIGKTIPTERVRLWHTNHRVGGSFKIVEPEYLSNVLSD